MGEIVSVEGSQGGVVTSADFTRISLNEVIYDPSNTGLPYFSQ